MADISGVSVILPTLDPAERVLNVVDGAAEQGFKDIIVIDDGSAADSLPIFEKLSGRRADGCAVSVLRHETNRGKGAALKTGFAFFIENRPDMAGVVTIDDDGQHLPRDISRCAEAMADSGVMVLGRRDFAETGVPAKSLIGNRFVAFLYKIETGIRLADTQTGLRAIPRGYLPAFLRVRGSRFEYETNVLLALRRERLAVSEIPIETVYIENNKATHFRTFMDSAIILFQFLKFSAGSLLSCCADLLIFYGLYTLLLASGLLRPSYAILLSTAAARVFSASLNFLFNSRVVFQYREKSGGAFLRYAALCVTVVVFSSMAVMLFARLPFINTPFEVMLSKAAADTVLFIINYQIQKKWVYRL